MEVRVTAIRVAFTIATATVMLTACGGDDPTDPDSGTERIPISDMTATQSYLGYAGGLYPGGNTIPAVHLAAGIARTKAIQPLDLNGNPSAAGKYVLVSIGMSNTTQEFCSASTPPCATWSFMGQASADPAVNRSALVIINGARGGQTASAWLSPTSAEYNRIRDSWLTPAGLSELQVQIAWVKVANAQPGISLPSTASDAFTLVSQMGTIARTLKQRYPNLQQIFFSSRIYAGYATTTLNPEPYAYETGFAVKWVVQAQIDQIQQNRIVDARAGDLDYRTDAPWLGWGPYLWGNGTTPRADGLVWTVGDLEGDGTHPAQSGEQKVGALLLNFFKTSPVTSCWFVASQTC
jgi:hypothetical protein